jgi:ribosomal protein L20A (L18A)
MLEMKRFNVYGRGFYEKRMEIKKLLKELNNITND